MTRLTLIVLTLLAIAGCSGIETETLREKPLLLKGMKTYQWAIVSNEQSDADNTNNLTHRFFRLQVDRIMAEKGYEKRVAGADMELDYRVMIMQEKRELYQADEITAAEYGIEWRFDRDSLSKRDWKNQEPSELEFYQKGKLVLGAIDTRTGKAVWLRSAEKPLDPDVDEDERKKVITQIAEKLLKPLPERKD